MTQVVVNVAMVMMAHAYAIGGAAVTSRATCMHETASTRSLLLENTT